jgi:integrase
MPPRTQKRRPKPWAETKRDLTRYCWRFNDERYRTPYYEDPDEAFADAQEQITGQMRGTWQDRSGSKMLLEDWIDTWKGLMDVGPKTEEKYKYLVESHILPEFEGRELGSLSFEEIEAWEKKITQQISARGTPFAPSVARGARSLLITILGDAVHAKKIDHNPAERRKGRRGRVKVKGRRASAHAGTQETAKVLTPVQALCLAERCALMSGRDIDFVMNVFAPWTGTRWGELMAVEGSEGKDSPLQLPDDGRASYALDWQLLELGGKVTKAPPKDDSYRVLDLPPFLADLMRWAVDNRHESCSCPPDENGRPACKSEDTTPANYLFLGPKGGHPRRSNYADDFLTPSAEGLHPKRNNARRPVYTTAEPWPGLPIRKGNRRQKAADIADGTWPDLVGKFKPHDYRHTHATWLDVPDIPKVLQMDRRGHVMAGMDATYLHITDDTRDHLCDYLQGLWQTAVAERYTMAPRSAVPLLNEILIAHEQRGKRQASRGMERAPQRANRSAWKARRQTSR